jgi:hypothetical protein
VKDLEQFVGATVVSIKLIDDEYFVVTLRLPDGEERDLSVYNAYGELLSVRIDGMFVPPEEV